MDEVLLPPSHFIPDFGGLFGDQRLVNRAQQLFSRLSLHPSSSISRLSATRAEQKAYYRLLGNQKVSESMLIEELCSRVSSLVSDRDVLCLQDTCEVNLSGQKGRLKPASGLGRSDNAHSSTCFKLHPGLVIDANSKVPLGFSALRVWHRPTDAPDRLERQYKSQAIEQKESYKWIEVAQASKERLATASRLTFVGDREADIFEQFARVPDAKTHLLVRSRNDRKLDDGTSLYNKVAAAPVAGSYTVYLPTDHRKNQQMEAIEVGVKFCQAAIQRPNNLPKAKYPDTITVSIVEVQQLDSDSSKRIHWRLITTHQVDRLAVALQMIEWYSARWMIEQVFRLLKRKGFGIEQAELESGWAIRKLAILQLSAILKIIQMNIAYNDPEQGQPIQEVFDQEQIGALVKLNNKLQGKTYKLQNHYDPNKTKWAAWILARLGGWKGYDSLGPPGVITLKRGLDRLAYIIEGMRLMEDVGTP